MKDPILSKLRKEDQSANHRKDVQSEQVSDQTTPGSNFNNNTYTKVGQMTNVNKDSLSDMSAYTYPQTPVAYQGNRLQENYPPIPTISLNKCRIPLLPKGHPVPSLNQNCIYSDGFSSNSSSTSVDLFKSHRFHGFDRSENRISKTSNRGRTTYTDEQIFELEKVFASNPYPTPQSRLQLSREIDVPEGKVKIWFQNRRARAKKVRITEGGWKLGSKVSRLDEQNHGQLLAVSSKVQKSDDSSNVLSESMLYPLPENLNTCNGMFNTISTNHAYSLINSTKTLQNEISHEVHMVASNQPALLPNFTIQPNVNSQCAITTSNDITPLQQHYTYHSSGQIAHESKVTDSNKEVASNLNETYRKPNLKDISTFWTSHPSCFPVIQSSAWSDKYNRNRKSFEAGYSDIRSVPSLGDDKHLRTDCYSNHKRKQSCQGTTNQLFSISSSNVPWNQTSFNRGKDEISSTKGQSLLRPSDGESGKVPSSLSAKYSALVRTSSYPQCNSSVLLSPPPIRRFVFPFRNILEKTQNVMYMEGGEESRKHVSSFEDSLTLQGVGAAVTSNQEMLHDDMSAEITTSNSEFYPNLPDLNSTTTLQHIPGFISDRTFPLARLQNLHVDNNPQVNGQHSDQPSCAINYDQQFHQCHEDSENMNNYMCGDLRQPSLAVTSNDLLSNNERQKYSKTYYNVFGVLQNPVSNTSNWQNPSLHLKTASFKSEHKYSSALPIENACSQESFDGGSMHRETSQRANELHINSNISTRASVLG